ncbi:MAG: hypothetical protein H6868_09125 [Rhodospirillales bacterium]|nr:hypothetical protein [Rhodospirillales bacterium]
MPSFLFAENALPKIQEIDFETFLGQHEDTLVTYAAALSQLSDLSHCDGNHPLKTGSNNLAYVMKYDMQIENTYDKIEQKKNILAGAWENGLKAIIAANRTSMKRALENVTDDPVKLAEQLSGFLDHADKIISRTNVAETSHAVARLNAGF